MIQRIQTVFILLAVIAQILLLSLPLAHYLLESNQSIDLYAIGFKDAEKEVVLNTIPLYILAWAILFLTVTSIFLYKKRILQIRICIYTMLLNLGLIGMVVLQLINFTKNNSVLSSSYALPMVIPVINIILLILAFRGIRKDEVLVKAYERLR